MMLDEEEIDGLVVIMIIAYFVLVVSVFIGFYLILF